MDDQQTYLKRFIILVMFVIVFITTNAVYINYTAQKQFATLQAKQRLDVKVATVRKVKIHTTLDEVDIMVRSVWMTDVTARLTGLVKDIYVEKGSIVHKGDPLFRVENIQMPYEVTQARAKVAEAEAKLLDAQVKRRRYEILVAEGAIAQQNYDDAVATEKVYQSEKEAAQAQYKALEALANQSIIYADRECQVLSVYCHTGYYIKEGEAALLLGDTKNMTFTTELTDKAWRQIKALGKEHFRLVLPSYVTHNSIYKVARRDKASGPICAQINYVEPSAAVEADKRLVEWKVVRGFASLEPTTYKDSKLVAESKVEVLGIPRSALINSRNNIVYVVDDDGAIYTRSVEVGGHDDDYVEILAGLKEGEYVATDSSHIYNIREGDRVRAIPEG